MFPISFNVQVESPGNSYGKNELNVQNIEQPKNTHTHTAYDFELGMCWVGLVQTLRRPKSPVEHHVKQEKSECYKLSARFSLFTKLFGAGQGSSVTKFSPTGRADSAKCSLLQTGSACAASEISWVSNLEGSSTIEGRSHDSKCINIQHWSIC